MNLTLTERDKKLLGLTACLAILAVFGVHLIRPALAEHEALGGEYEAALQKQQEYQAQIDARAALDDSIAQNEAALKTVGEPYYPAGLETRQMDDIITGIALKNGLFPQSLTLTEAVPGAVSVSEGSLEIVTNDPLNYFAFEEVRQLTGCHVVIRLSELGPLQSAIRYYYAEVGAQQAAQTANEGFAGSDAELVRIEESESGDPEAPIVKLLSSLLDRAVSTGASDIHIEPFEGKTRVRMRIDGTIVDHVRIIADRETGIGHAVQRHVPAQRHGERDLGHAVARRVGGDDRPALAVHLLNHAADAVGAAPAAVRREVLRAFVEQIKVAVMPRLLVGLHIRPDAVSMRDVCVLQLTVPLTQYGPVSLHEQREGLGDLRKALEQMIRALLIDFHTDVAAVNADARCEHHSKKHGQQSDARSFFHAHPSLMIFLHFLSVP